MVGLERLVAVERIEDMRLEARMRRVERLAPAGPRRSPVARRVVALVGRGGAREEAAVRSAYEAKGQVG